MALTKDQLRTENQNSFPDNTDGLITPQILRDYNDDVIDSLVVSADTGSLVTTTTFNDFSQSTDSRLDNIETTTSSLQTQIDNIDTGSLLETASVNLNTITFTKADASTFDITVDTGSGVATDITALNEFTSSQLTINSGYNTFTESADNRLDNIETFTGSLSASQVGFVSQSTSLTSSNVQDAITELDITKAPISALSSNIIVYPTTAASSIAGYSILVTSPDEVGYNTTAVDVPTGVISGSNQFIAALATTGSLFQGNPGVINITTLGNVRRTGGGNNSSADFYFEVYKRSGSVETLIATSDTTREVNTDTYEEFNASALLNNVTFTEDDVIVTKYYGSLINPAGADPSFDFQFGGSQPIRTLIPVPASVITDPTLTLRVDNLEQFTASQETINGGYNQFTQSAETRLDSIEAETGSYATTGSNTFTQTQTLEQDLVVQGNLYVSGAEVIISSSELIVGDRIIEVNANKLIGDAGLYAYDAIGDQTGSIIWNPTLDYWLVGLSGSEEKVLVSSDTASLETSVNALNSYTQSTDGRLTNIELTTASFDGRLNNIELTTASLDSSISQLNTFSGSTEGRLNNIELATGSYATTGANTFTGLQTISGSSAYEVISPSIASLTASIDFVESSIQTLTLVSGSDTHIVGTNVDKGQTINLLVKQPAVGTGSLSFSPDFLQATGSEYTPTPTSDAKDILTFITFDSTTEIYVSNITELV